MDLGIYDRIELLWTFSAGYYLGYLPYTCRYCRLNRSVTLLKKSVNSNSDYCCIFAKNKKYDLFEVNGVVVNTHKGNK